MSEFIKLSQWAKEQNVEYVNAWKQVKSGVFPHKTKISNTNRIWVEVNNKNDKTKELNAISPMFAGEASQSLRGQSLASARRNRAATTERTDPFFHIENGIEPFQFGRATNNSSKDFISINDAIRLTQKCYYNFSIFRNTIDVMTEFSSNSIFLRNGNAKSKEFFEELFKKIGILDLQDKFFREYYRSGNVFLYRFETQPQPEDVSKINKAYGSFAKILTLPVKYIVLNPSDIVVGGSISFANSKFFKNLNTYEIERLKNPQTEEDEKFLQSLPPEIIKQINDNQTAILVPLSPEQVYGIFYKKQDYEPLAVPMGFPVLKDINYKEEMKEIDMAISRTTHRAILLITMGYESKNGDYMVDAKTIQATQSLFESESIGKTLVADFTTKAEFVVPPIGELLDPKKYEIVNEDIRMGLNNILVGKNEKFANQHIQVNLFIQRLTQAREVFLTQFLIPEIQRISKQMGFKSYPEPYFKEFDLKDEAEFNRIVIRLAEIGFFTPEETFTAMQDGRFPTKEESEVNQEEFVNLKKQGFYEPIVGGPATQKELADKMTENQLTLQESEHAHSEVMVEKEAKLMPPKAPGGTTNIPKGKLSKQPGRKSGDTRKQSTKKTSPISKSKASLVSLTKAKENLHAANDLLNLVKSKLVSRFKVKSLNEEQVSIANSLVESIMMNEPAVNWNESTASNYIEKPDTFNEDRYKAVQNVAYEHQVDNFLAAIIAESYKDNA